MEITEVKVFPVSEEKLKAFVSVVFDRCFMVNDIKIIQGRDGLFVSMPSRKKKNGEFKDVAHPLNNDTRRMIELEVVDEYERVLAERGESLPAPPRTFPDPEESSGAQQYSRPPSDDSAGNGDGRGAGSEGKRQREEAPPLAAAADGKAGSSDGDAGSRAKEETDKETEDKSLEEVQEMHLRDSFWSVS